MQTFTNVGKRLHTNVNSTFAQTLDQRWSKVYAIWVGRWLPSHHRLSNSDSRSDQCYLELTRSLFRVIFGSVAVVTCRRFGLLPFWHVAVLTKVQWMHSKVRVLWADSAIKRSNRW